MARQQRLQLISEIEGLRGSKVVCYLTGDRPPAPAQIGDDALRPLYDHLRLIGPVEKLDLFIYSRGGASDVPWRIVSALRQCAENWSILIPFRAQSAATLIALGADEIVMGPQAELGPIDPQLTRVTPGAGGPIQEQISVEDVMAYVRFVQSRAGLSDQDALASALGKLTDRLDAVTLGNVYRTHSHIRDVARRVLLSRKAPANEQILSNIIELLAEKVYAHGHAIGIKSAKEIGLPVKSASADEDRLMWSLLTDYEDELKIRSPLDPAAAVAAADVYSEPATTAIIESAAALHTFSGDIEVRARRQMPQALNVALNINVQLPATVNPAQLPQAVQMQLQQLIQEAQQIVFQAAQPAVQQALQQQAPLLGVEVALRNASWKKVA